MMDGLPNSVRVSAHSLKLVPLRDEDEPENFGMFYPADAAIGLAEKFPSGSVAVEIVLHEMTHAILHYGGFASSDEVNEQICQLVGAGFAQSIRDNPELIAWLQETVKR